MEPRPAAPDAFARARGGALPLRAFEAAGITRADVGRALAERRLLSIRRGWYGVPDAPSSVIRAVRVGGSLTGASVARLHGLWLLDDDERLHVRVKGNASRLRSPTDRHLALSAAHHVCVHYRDTSGGPSDLPARDGLPRALAEMFSCGPSLAAVIAVDSALNLRQLTAAGRAELRAAVPSSLRRTIDAADASCESGLETIARLVPRARNIPYRTQAYIPGVGRVDLLIGDRLVVELDGADFHIDHADFAEDRRRGLELVMRGYLVVRLTYRMVIHDWERVRADLLELVGRGEHRWGARATAWAR